MNDGRSKLGPSGSVGEDGGDRGSVQLPESPGEAREKKVLMMVRVKCTLGEHRQGIDLPHNNYDLLILIRVSTKTKWI